MSLSQNSLSVNFILKIVNSHMYNILSNVLLVLLYIVVIVLMCNIFCCLMCNLLHGKILYLFNKFEYVYLGGD